MSAKERAVHCRFGYVRRRAGQRRRAGALRVAAASWRNLIVIILCHLQHVIAAKDVGNLAKVVACLVRREAPRFAANPKRWIEAWRELRI
jgi:hypothetical protein